MKTIQRRIDKVKISVEKPIARKVIVLMDTTYWGRNFGVTLFKDAITKENLLKYYVRNETNAIYTQGIEKLKALGFQIQAIVCEEERDLFNHLTEFQFRCVNLAH
ncbi:hypothetical protein ACILDR_10705 [Capnocytophaga canimorsus]|uniref:hypothetical protein n=1 Tax=Capnocytophaga canimorsus TaxID=28188 RepID=UPI001E3D4E39|nr:hypothetical protein [Capnocytophaga canimorsus]